MPLLQTSGNITADGYGGGVPAAGPSYIEDVFSTYLYTGNGSTQTITNGIDLSTKGGLVWNKKRSTTQNHYLTSTAQGTAKQGSTNNTNAFSSNADVVTAFLTTGFSVGSTEVNDSGATYASWTFRKQPKFFDVLTYSGTGVAGRTVAHSLGSVPACMIVKRTDAAGGWYVYHTSLGATKNLQLSSTLAAATRTQIWNDTAPTSTVFSLGTDTDVNASGGTYVAYLFAHNAGGFGLTGTDNVISCGSYTGNGSATGPIVTLGYEPQWVLVKRATVSTGNWILMDNMRGLNVSTGGLGLYANTTDGEGTIGTLGLSPSATGFYVTETSSALNASGSSYIYIAIRRGPMKVPTVGTTVFNPITYVGANGAAQNISAGFPVDMDIIKIRNVGTRDPLNHARLMGNVMLQTNATAAEASYSDNIVSFNNAQNVIGLPVTGGGTNEINGASSSTYVAWAFRRAPSFMDVVCYTGNGTVGNTVNHNLTIVPELIIVKRRSAATQWGVGTPSIGWNYILSLNTTNGKIGPDAVSYWNNTAPTSTIFTVGDTPLVNANGSTYVAYLFATCAGVSKVGSYTGNGTLTTINCGFTGGARFVLIKRTDSTGNWFVWDTSRGMVSGNDPSLAWNLATADNNANSVYTIATGFQLLASPSDDVNTNGGTYIFLAIA